MDPFPVYFTFCVAALFCTLALFQRYEGRFVLAATLAVAAFAYATDNLSLAYVGMWLAVGFVWSLIRWTLLCWEFCLLPQGIKIAAFAGEMLMALFMWPLSILRTFSADALKILVKLDPYAAIQRLVRRHADKERCSGVRDDSF